MYANNLLTLNNVPTLSVGAENCSNVWNSDITLPLHSGDEIFVSAVRLGRVILDRCFSGFTDMQALLREVRACIGATPGLITLNLRNRTGGWTTKRVVRVSRAAVSLLATA